MGELGRQFSELGDSAASLVDIDRGTTAIGTLARVADAQFCFAIDIRWRC